MVRGLDVFREHFAGHADQFVLIGGTAATLAMQEAGLEFRATRDLDIVLPIEALSPTFGEVFWSFVEAGGYEIRQASDTKNIRKHANDVLRLSQLLAPDTRIPVADFRLARRSAVCRGSAHAASATGRESCSTLRAPPPGSNAALSAG